jgi:hypothetical protein
MGTWTADERTEVARYLGIGLKVLLRAWQDNDTLPPKAEIEAALFAIQSLAHAERQPFLPAVADAVLLGLLAHRNDGVAFSRLPAWQEKLLTVAGGPLPAHLWDTTSAWIQRKNRMRHLGALISRRQAHLANLQNRLSAALGIRPSSTEGRTVPPSAAPSSMFDRFAIQLSDLGERLRASGRFDQLAVHLSDLGERLRPSNMFDRFAAHLSDLDERMLQAVTFRHRHDVQPSLDMSGGLVFDLNQLPIESNDKKLVSAWIDLLDAASLNMREESSRTERRRSIALFAARLAERCVGVWLRRNKGYVEDLSIQQVANPSFQDWVIGDLRTADGAIFDVKNTIRHENWLESWIKKTKRAPDGSEVAYVATHTRLTPDSDPWTNLQIDGRLPARLAIMGIAKRATITSLGEWVERTTSRVALLPGNPEHFRLAPFYFNLAETDWPESRRLARANAIASAWLGWDRLGLKCHPSLGLLAGLPPEAVSGDENIRDLYRWFSERLIERRSLGTIYLLLLDHFALHFKNGRIIFLGKPMQIASYRDLLFPDLPGSESRLLPAWQWDATGMVSRALSAMASLLRSEVILPELQRLYVTSQSVVSATIATDTPTETRTVTLLAHCSDCGTFPLIFGKEKTCPGCGRLICTRWHNQHGCTCGRSVGPVDDEPQQP